MYDPSHNDYPKYPNCEYQRDESDKLMNAMICAACGIIYNRWRPESQIVESDIDEVEELQTMSLYESLKDCFLSVPHQVDSMVFKGRVFAYLVIIIWGCYFMLGGIDWQNIGSSFLHNVNLAFHEFGHVLFMPFGDFWMILGGSLFQVLLPLIVMLAFSIQQRDNFGAAIMLWWCGQSFIDVSPYIADAQSRSLQLISGLGKESHDWGNLLGMTNNLHNTDFIAQSSFTIGCCIMLLSFIWAGALLLKQKRVLS